MRLAERDQPGIMDETQSSYLIVLDRVKARRLAPGNQRRSVRPNCAIRGIHLQRVPLRVATRDQHGKRNRENQCIDEGKHLGVSEMKSSEKGENWVSEGKKLSSKKT